MKFCEKDYCNDLLADDTAIDMDDMNTTSNGYDDIDGVPPRIVAAPFKYVPPPPLIKAIQFDDLVEAQQVIKDNPDSIGQTYQDLTPLMIACQGKNIAMLQLLINSGADISQTNSLGYTALHCAAVEHWIEGAILLIENGASVNAMIPRSVENRGVYRESPLHHVIRTADVHMTFLMLGRKDNSSAETVEDKGGGGAALGTPSYLQYSGRSNNLRERSGIQKNKSRDRPSPQSKTPPDLYLRDGYGRSVVHLAAMSKSKEILEAILSYKETEPLATSKDIQENTPLHSLFWDMTENADEDVIIHCVNVLLELGVDINSSNVKGQTAIFLATKQKLSEVLLHLLKKGADPCLVTTDGWTTLHAACSADCSKCLRYLLNTGLVTDLIYRETDTGKVPFHMATCSYSLCCIKLLLKTHEHLSNKDTSGRTRFSLLLNNVPSAKQILQEIFDEQITASKHREHEAEYALSFNYSMLLEPNLDVLQCSLVSELTTSSYMEDLLSHPLLESFLFLKWGRIRPFFYTHFAIYVMFLILHTFYVLFTFGAPARDWSQQMAVLNAFRVFHLVVFLLILIPDLIFMLANVKKYLQQWETYVKVIALGSSAYIVFSPHVEKPGTMPVERHVAAISAFFTWAELMMLIGRFPVLGVYILMFTKVARSIITFLFAFSSLIVGFAIAFQILFNQIHTFRNFPASLVRTLMMMVGEIDYSSIVADGGMPNPVLGYVFLVAFLFLVPVLMANLLIGLAVSDLPDLSKQGKIKRLSKQASYLTTYELLILFFKDFRCFPRYIRAVLARRCEIKDRKTFYPNKRNFRHRTVWKWLNEEISTETLEASYELIRKVRQRKLEELEYDTPVEKKSVAKVEPSGSIRKPKYLRSLSIISKNTNSNESEAVQLLKESYEEFTKEYKKDFQNLKIYLRSHMGAPSSPKGLTRARGSPQLVVAATGKDVKLLESSTNEALTQRVTRLEEILNEQNKNINALLKQLQGKAFV